MYFESRRREKPFLVGDGRAGGGGLTYFKFRRRVAERNKSNIVFGYGGHIFLGRGAEGNETHKLCGL